jgi:hypothetical protein
MNISKDSIIESGFIPLWDTIVRNSSRRKVELLNYASILELNVIHNFSLDIVRKR